MPKPEPKFVTLEIDGREVRAPEGAMLVDGAKYGDVEIPVFCYEPKLGQPVGACRMCLVEIEGIPKLQTGCSTPVKDGMVVNTKTDRVRAAQNAIVEFLLVNHPLDCPVCDKGGECPLQWVTFGWGAGRSRFIEPKRHFKKPLELSPTIAIDRERCILCFRCVRFSQEISEDYQLVFLERGDHTYVSTHSGHPYVAPFSGNIIDLCPVGALTSAAYRFRARPWDVVEAGSVCNLCPAQCNVTFTVRDDTKVMRATSRENVDVDGGWLCDKGRFGYQAIHSGDRITQPMMRDGGDLRPVSWDRALAAAASGLERAGARTAALVGGATSNEEGFLLQGLMRHVLGSPHIDSRTGGRLSAGHARVLARPELTAAVPDLEYAGAVLVVDTELQDEAPILDLRVRKGVRQSRVKVVTMTSAPGALDPNAEAIVRFAPGAGEAALAALTAALPLVGADEQPTDFEDQEAEGQTHDQGGLADAALATDAFGESRQGDGAAHGDGDGGLISGLAHRAAEALSTVLPGRRSDEPDDATPAGDGAETPSVADAVDAAGGRGLLPGGPSLDELAARAGTTRAQIENAATALKGNGPVVILWGERLSHGERGGQGVDALLSLADALDVSTTEGAGLMEVPEGTNGRGLREVGCLPNLAPGLAEASPAGRSAGEIATALGDDLSALVLLHADPLRTHPDRRAWERALERATAVIAVADFLSPGLAEQATVVFPAESYAEKEGTLVHPDGRLQRLRQAMRPPAGRRAAEPDPVPEPVSADGGLRLGVVRSLWAAGEVEHSPIIAFRAAEQRAELAPADARRLGVDPGDEVEVSVDGTSVHATARLRQGVPEGTVFMVAGTSADNATELTTSAGAPTVVSVRRAGRERAGDEVAEPVGASAP